MDKQDELAVTVCAARIGIEFPEGSEIEPSDDDVRIAAAVRSYMGSAKVKCAAVEACREDPFCDDIHLLGTTQQELRMAHYSRAALSAALGTDIGGGRG